MIMNEAGSDLGQLAAELLDGSICTEATESAPASAAVGMVVAGREIDLAAAGDRTTDGDPTDSTTRYDLASVTKLFTTTAVMRLVSEGAVSLDAPIDRWLPVPAPVPTVRDLLRHRGGLQPWQPLYLEAAGRDRVVDLIARLPRVNQPNVERRYSDLGFMLLGFMIEEITGRDLPTALTELIMNPLELDVGFGPIAPDTAAGSSLDDRVEMRMVATGDPYPVLLEGSFDRWRREPVLGEVNDCNAHHALGGIAGHAGLFATVSDLVRFGVAVGDPSHGLWTPEVLAEFAAPGPDPQQGLGFRLHSLPDGRNLLWHPGFTGTALGVVPSQRATGPVVVAMATNRLLVSGRPLTTERLWLRVLEGTGLLSAPAATEGGVG